MDHLTGMAYAGMGLGAAAIVLGLAVALAQQASRTSISVGLTLGLFGLITIWGYPVWDQVDAEDPQWSARLFAFALGGFMAASASYMVGLLQTSMAPPERIRQLRVGITLCYVSSGAATVLCFLFPAEFLNDFAVSIAEPGFFTSRGFWIFGPFFAVVAALFVLCWLALARQRLDVGERSRALCAAVISIFVAMGVVAPVNATVVIVGLVILIGTYGQFHYLVVQGERGAFLGRFLSPAVAELVRNDGLASVTEPGQRDVTVVACDLRGFTSYAEAVPSQAVIDLLGEYYEAVGAAVAEHGGTIKDYAGDGVLILIGAPLSREDHATAGPQLARRLHAVVGPVLKHWGTEPHPLGLGVGIASGPVTVGAVGSTSRLEYTAVGTAVNIASRLCSAATDGEILVDQSTVDVAGIDGLSSRGSMPIKGLIADHQIYAVDSPHDPSVHP
jgi:class 3 adenylate cyclase